MRATRIIPIATLAVLMGTVACQKPAPVPAAPTQAEQEATAKKASDEAAAVAAKAAAEESARKAAAEESARKAAAEESARKAAEAEKANVFKQSAGSALKNIHFDYDKYDIKQDDRAILQGIADFMKAFPAAKLEIEGHCDERGTNEYNLALGNKRAAAALAYLKTLGVDEARLTTISYGKEKPLCTEAKESCWSQNRRDEFKLK
jgi:peptidoglycan-associated lipoprotein